MSPAQTAVATGPGLPAGTLSFDPNAGAQINRLLEDLAQLYAERNEALRQVTESHHDALFRLAMAAEYKDDDTGVHIVRIGMLAERLALRLGQSRTWSAMLRKAAPMHDIGKIGIPDAILKKPGRLTSDDRQVINSHPQIGADLLGRSKAPLFEMAAEVAMTHHERFDGTGYPRGLSGLDIPLAGRIVAVVDFFDALTMDRCYRQALDDEEVHLMITAERGAAFDPLIVDVMLLHWQELTTLRDHVTRLAPDFRQLAAGLVDIDAFAEVCS